MNAEQARGLVQRAFADSIAVKRRSLEANVDDVLRIAARIEQALREHNKVVLFGNGGSAADAQHVAGELVNRFLIDRRALPALALTTDTSILTSIANDAGYDQVFARQVEALVTPGDVVVGISTSGNSPNVLRGVEAAREQGATTIGFTGQAGGALKELVDICLCVPSDSTPRIQEAHITIFHVVCEIVEEALFGG